MNTTDKQNRTKAGILCEQLRKHCKSKSLQCFIFMEGDDPGKNVVAGYFSDHMIASAVQHLFMWKPELVREAIKQVEEFAGQPPAEEPTKSLIIQP